MLGSFTSHVKTDIENSDSKPDGMAQRKTRMIAYVCKWFKGPGATNGFSLREQFAIFTN